MNNEKEKSNVWLKRRGETANPEGLLSKVLPLQGPDTFENSDKCESESLTVNLNDYKIGSLKITNNSKIYLVISILALVAFVSFSFWYVDYTKPKFYCTEKHIMTNIDEKDCLSCPTDSICKNGSIVECIKEKILIGNECVTNSEVGLLRKKMRVKLEEILSEARGNELCGYSSDYDSMISLKNAIKHLLNLFGHKNGFEDAKNELVDEFLATRKIYPEHIATLSTNTVAKPTIDDTYLESKKTVTPCICKIFKISNIHTWIIWSLILFVIVYSYKTNWLLILNENVDFAENLYKCVLFLSINNGRIQASSLTSFLPERLSASRKKNILAILDEVIAKDAQLLQETANSEKYYSTR